jgi:predicted permease
VQQALREGGRTALAATREPVRLALVVAEVAIALTLLAGGGLLIRSAMYLDRVNPGFDPRGLLAARITLRSSPDLSTDAARAEQTFSSLVAQLRAWPGVQSAAVTSATPFVAGGSSNGLIPEGREQTIANAIDARMHMVSPGYLETMRIPLVAGRDIDERDIRGGVRVMVVSAALAKAAWPGENPIGKRISCCEGSPADPRWKTVIGVAADVQAGGPTQQIRPAFYIPMAQAPIEAWRWTDRTMAVVVRATAADPTSLAPAVREVMHAIDPTAPVYGVAKATDRLAQTLAESRFHLLLLVTLGVLGLLLAAAGLYSVIAYFVTMRTHEIGVRMALGATPRDVLRLLTWSGLRPVLAGATLGTVAALWITRLLRGSLYGVSPDDPATFAAVIAMLLAVSLVAILIPARRATSVDPSTALGG